MKEVISDVKNLKFESESALKIQFLIKNYLKNDFIVDSIYTSGKVNNYLSDLFCDPSEFFYGIEKDGVLVAFIHYKELVDRVHLNNIVVKKEESGLGVGRFLINKLFEFSEETNKKITLHVDSRNKYALSWYLRLGFTVKQRYVKTMFLNDKNDRVGGQEIINNVVFDNSEFFNYGFSYGVLLDNKLDVLHQQRVGFILPCYLRFLDAGVTPTCSDIKQIVNGYKCIPIFRGDVSLPEKIKNIVKLSWCSLLMEK